MKWNQLPISAARWQHGSQISFATSFWWKITIYFNKKASYIDIYFYDPFLWNPNFKHLRFNILDTLSDILDKGLRFSLIKIESVSILITKPRLVASLSSVVYTFLLNSFN
jgi:hypothetical protein